MTYGLWFVAICLLGIAVYLQRSSFVLKRMTLWTETPALLRHRVRRELETLNSAILNNLGVVGTPPATLRDLLAAVRSDEEVAICKLLMSGSDWWETPFRYEVNCDGRGCDIIVQSDGPNRTNENGRGDDVRIVHRLYQRIEPVQKAGRQAGDLDAN